MTFLVHGMMLQPTEPAGQGSALHFSHKLLWFPPFSV